MCACGTDSPPDGAVLLGRDLRRIKYRSKTGRERLPIRTLQAELECLQRLFKSVCAGSPKRKAQTRRIVASYSKFSGHLLGLSAG